MKGISTFLSCLVLFRILVQSGVHDEFVDALRRSIEGLKQGGPFEDGVNVGPLIHEAAVSKVLYNWIANFCLLVKNI